MKINAKDYKILPGQEITKKLIKLLDEIRQMNSEVTLFFEKGDYFFNQENSTIKPYYMTNTVGEREYDKGQDTTPYRHIGILLKDISGLTIDGNNSMFYMHGFMTNMIVDNCKNIKIKNLSFDHIRPSASEVVVLKKTFNSITFQFDKDSEYVIEDGILYTINNKLKQKGTFKSQFAFWHGTKKANDKDFMTRCAYGHPFKNAMHFSDLGDRKVLVKYPPFMRPKAFLGETRIFFDDMRSEVGTFIDLSQNIIFENFAQHFNHSMAMLVQRSDNLSYDNIKMVPSGDRTTTSTADFMHFCMCSGDIVVKNSEFNGAFDDIINVHGIHFEVVNITNNIATIKFCHPQAYGFNPHFVGDEIRFIDQNSLLCVGTSTITKSDLIDNYTLKLTLNCTPTNLPLKICVENASRCPNLTFVNNKASCIATRGMLVTTSGKVLIDNNEFYEIGMSAILISDDAKNWYESGLAKDITITNNKFIKCAINAVLILPENSKHDGYVHNNILIENNHIILREKSLAATVKSSGNVVFKNNIIENSNGKNIFKITNSDFKSENNTIR